MRTRVVVAPPAYARAPRRRLVRPKRRSFVRTALAVVGRVLVTMPRRYGDAGAPVSVRSTRGAGTILVTADQFRLGPRGGPGCVFCGRPGPGVRSAAPPPRARADPNKNFF